LPVGDIMLVMVVNKL